MGASTTRMQDLRGRFEAQWALLHPTVPIEMPNQATPISKAGEWGRWSELSDGAPEFEAAGEGSSELFVGTVQLEFFTALGTGEAGGRVLADSVATIWRGYPLARYTFQPTEVIPIGRTETDGGARFKTDTLTRFEHSYQP